MKPAARRWNDERYYRIASAAVDGKKLLIRFDDGTSFEVDTQRILPPETAARWAEMTFTPYEIVVPIAGDSQEISGSSLRALTDREYGIHLDSVAEEQARHVGRRIKQLRLDRGISGKDLADRAGLSPQSLSRIEHGHHDVVFTTLQRILAAMGASVKDLVVADDENPEDAGNDGRPNGRPVSDVDSVNKKRHQSATRPEKQGVSFELLADEPITGPDEDLLGRKVFAQALARALIARSREPMVIALQGTWGSGKTSLLNMTIAYLAELAESSNNTVIFPFNPWNFATQADLVQMFFSELVRKLKAPDVSKRINWAHELATKLDDYADALSPIIELAPIPGTVLKGVRAGIKAMRKASERDQPTIPQLRDEIDRQLSDWDGRLLILVDDIDRLTAPEIRQIFQLVKLTADFPNTTYLLAFDPQVVADALRHETAWPGEEYLEKIVQVPLQVPAIEPDRIRSFMLDGVRRLLSSHPNRFWDERYFWTVYLGGFEDLFKSIRDVKRFLSSVGITLNLMGQDLSIADLLAVEALRITVPKVHAALSASRSLLLETRIDVSQQPGQQRDFKELVSLASPSERGSVTRLLRLLFPGLARIDTNTDVTALTPEWQRQGRIAAPQNFDAFFLMSPKSGDVQQRDVDEFLGALSTAERADGVLRDFDRRGLLNGFLNRLTDRSSDVQEADRETALRLVLTAISDFDTDFSAPFSPQGSVLMRALNFCRQVFLQYQAPDERETSVGRVLASVPLDSALRLLSRLAPGENASPINEVLDEESAKRLKPQLMRRVQQRAEDGTLLSERRLLIILAHWFAEEPDAAREWARKVAASDDGLLRLLRSTVATGYVNGEPFRYMPELVTRKLLAWDQVDERLKRLGQRDRSVKPIHRMARLGENAAIPRFSGVNESDFEASEG
jgi:predicted KAP-like P-loop ATPase/DNA-binding Xre family transcriptional regulator